MQIREKILALAIIVLVLFGLYSFANDEHWVAPAEAKKKQNPIKPTPGSIQKGKEIYQKKCLLCHGETGDGKGPVAKQLKGTPGDLTNAKEMKEMTDGELFWKITTGSDPMPRFEKQLTADERWNVVNYIRTFASQSKQKSTSENNAGGKKEKN